MSGTSEKRDGFGIGEAGKVPASTPLDELEAERLQPHKTRPLRAGDHYAPAGTTNGVHTPGEHCSRCGEPADWNPGAGEYLCYRHWDAY